MDNRLIITHEPASMIAEFLYSIYGDDSGLTLRHHGDIGAVHIFELKDNHLPEFELPNERGKYNLEEAVQYLIRHKPGLMVTAGHMQIHTGATTIPIAPATED